jgi:hypothetical protein
VCCGRCCTRPIQTVRLKYAAASCKIVLPKLTKELHELKIGARYCSILQFTVQSPKYSSDLRCLRPISRTPGGPY